MKNKQSNNFWKFYVVTPTEKFLLTSQYSDRGVYTVFHGYSDTVLGKAGGYGYDKESTALNEAIKNLTGIDLKVSGEGFRTLCQEAYKKGIDIYDYSSLIENIINYEN